MVTAFSLGVIASPDLSGRGNPVPISPRGLALLSEDWIATGTKAPSR